MTINFEELSLMLSQWPEVEIPNSNSTDSINGRALQILKESQDSGYLRSPRDLQALIRDALRIKSLDYGFMASLSVPASSDWPTENQWSEFGVKVVEVQNESHYKIESETWNPKWLGADDIDILEDMYALKPCRTASEVPIDPCVQKATGFEHYTSPGQQAAIRSLFFAREGSTLVVTLPTGSGKSLVGYLPSLLLPVEGNITVFVVPTVALALDQERQVHGMLLKNTPTRTRFPLAWHSGLLDEDRSLIKQNIRSGKQSIIFTSPEGVCGSLRPALYEAARKGFLSYFVVDEAHLVAQWGDEFRPDFQGVAGIRNGLLRACPSRQFKTLLMTATLTDQTMQVLETLFASKNGFNTIAAVHLRPEPRYWIHKAVSSEEKDKYVREVVRFAPRPLILYVTERKDAERWYKKLREEEGFERIACFHGNTPPERRKTIVHAWSKGDLEIVVATSAFGLGIDKGDIRSVIHACVPETLDRFYQEVGRGGRDGKPSLSLLVYTDRDFQVAARMGKPAIITQKLGRSRWETLINNYELVPGSDELISIDLSRVPNHVSQQSDSNKAWNLRTVLLLVRAGIIEIDAESPPKYTGESNDNGAEDVDNYFDHIIIKIINPRHLDADVWEGPIAKAKNASIQAGHKNFSLLRGAIEYGKEMGESLTELYRFTRPNYRIEVSKVCGGCPRCRQDGVTDIMLHAIDPVQLQETAGVDMNKWYQCFPHLTPNPSVVTYNPIDGNIENIIAKIIKTMVSELGISELAFSDGDKFNFSNEITGLYLRTPSHFVVHSDITEGARGDYSIPLPRLSILYPWTDAPIPKHLLESFWTRPMHIIIAPENVKDDLHPLRKYCDTANNCIGINEFNRRLNQ